MNQIDLNIIEEDEDDPILSVVNMVDLFLVVIAVLLIIVMSNPINPFNSAEDVMVIKNAGQPNMEILVKEGDELKEYKSTGQMGEGKGSKAGVAYRLEDGSMIYVPEDSTKK
ncbi:DUF2149 domain-containing protein [Thiomicrorhabdus xiamenensis]|uniref:DUF2149 domain-containing protein n=1 Tax=Thiomicrorhabdus xiamenensis TaxID=2739063 RepID=A0A7D4T1R0_9GAMM|nr:DUF2149 domain-containing protein [Thiomicrorhabdus xiamenensis]QKI90122.1 DUF2149 domain-containing protein [Thiomicrorhabdus xiamenensis]